MTWFRNSVTFSQDACQTFRLTLGTAGWVEREMFSRVGRYYMLAALGIYLVAYTLELLAPYFMGRLAEQPTEDVDRLFAFMLGSLLLGVVIERVGSALREWGWNLNTRSLKYNATYEWLRRTPGEIDEEDRDIGAHQIDSCTSSMHEVQRTVYFQFVPAFCTMVTCIGLASYLHTTIGLWLVGIFLTNLVALFYMNHFVHLKASVIDARIRASHNRLAEYWLHAVDIIVAARQLYVLSWLKEDLRDILWDDYQLWGWWWPIADGLRSVFTTIAVMYVMRESYFMLTVGEWVTLCVWITIYREQFWKIGDAQRTLAEHSEKLHALRKEFEKEPAYDHFIGTPTTNRS